jgi:hypothetical protein
VFQEAAGFFSCIDLINVRKAHARQRDGRYSTVLGFGPQLAFLLAGTGHSFQHDFEEINGHKTSVRDARGAAAWDQIVIKVRKLGWQVRILCNLDSDRPLNEGAK